MKYHSPIRIVIIALLTFLVFALISLGAVFLFSLAARHGEDDWRSHEHEALSELTHQQPLTFLYPYTVEFFDADGKTLDVLAYDGYENEGVTP